PGDPFPAPRGGGCQTDRDQLRTMLPDLRIQIDAMVAEDDMVVSRYTTTATDPPGYRGKPPTGRTIRTSAMRMFRLPTAKSLRAGRHATIWVSWFSLDICRQCVHRKMSQNDLSVEPRFTRELLSNPADGLR